MFCSPTAGACSVTLGRCRKRAHSGNITLISESIWLTLPQYVLTPAANNNPSEEMARFDSVPSARFDQHVRMDSPDGPPPGTTPKRKMAEPALKLARSTVNDVKTLAGSMAVGLTDNPTLVPTPKVTPTQLTDAVEAVSQQEILLAAAEANVGTQRDILNQKLDTLKGLMTNSADDSTVVVGREAVKMGMLNIPVKSAATPAPVAGPPQNFAVTQGDHTTEADGQCDRVARASLYKGEHASSPSGPWIVGYEGKKSSFTMNGFTPGEEKWFRMAAFVGDQWTDWSDPAKCRIL